MFSDSQEPPKEGETKPFFATVGGLGGETESAQGLSHWPKGRGCNIPELPVESALDQVHSQAGAYQPLASRCARWPQASPALALLGHSSPSVLKA